MRLPGPVWSRALPRVVVLHEFFRRAHRAALADDVLGEQVLFVGRFDPEQHLGVADAQPLVGQPFLHPLVEVEQAHRVGHGRPALADFARDVLLPQAEFGGQPLVGARLFDHVEVRALQIFDQGEFQDLLVARLPHDGGRMAQRERPGGAPPALAGDQFVMRAHLAHDQRLDDPLLPDRLDQFAERIRLEILARLKGAAANVFELDLADHLTGRRPHRSRSRRHGAAAPRAAGRTGLDQRAQTPSKNVFCHPPSIEVKAKI